MARILVFAYDLNEAAQIRRIRMLMADGHQVTSASMRRTNMTSGDVPDWPDIPLGIVENERFLRRCAVIASSICRMWLRRGAIARSDLVIARNFDMAFIAWLGGLAAGGRRPLVYECLDIHGLFTRKGLVGGVMRWVERRLLAHSDLLLTSSPGFLRHYFGPVQGYRGPVALLENKLWFDGLPEERPRIDREMTPALPRANAENSRTPAQINGCVNGSGSGSAEGRGAARTRPLVLGWVGSIRCAPSLDLLLTAADRLGDRVAIEIHGNIHEHVIPDFQARIAGRRNVRYHGPYLYPDDLGRIYGGLDLVWAQDLWQRCENSDWLLPNRIYEASYFGCPSLAVEGTETGRRVREDRLGAVIARPDPEAMLAVLRALSEDAIEQMRAALLDRDPSAFRMAPGEVTRALAPVLGPVHAPGPVLAPVPDDGAVGGRSGAR